MVLKFSEFEYGLTNGKQFPIYILVGDDAYFRERGLALLKERFLSEPSLNLVKFDGKNCDEKEVLASLSMYPFLSEKRITIVEEFYPVKETLASLKEYLKSPSEFGLLIISNQKDFAGSKNLDKACVVECVKAEVPTIVRWIREKCVQHDIEIEYETAKKIAENCLCDMTKISNEVEKLISYAIDDKKITNDTVELLVSRDTDFKIYQMTESVAKKDFDSAIDIIDDLLKKDDNSIGIISGIHKHFRRLLHTAISGINNEELSTYFGIKEFAVEKLRNQAKKFKVKSLKRAVDLLGEADFKIKSGEANQKGITWLTIFTIMSE